MSVNNADAEAERSFCLRGGDNDGNSQISAL